MTITISKTEILINSLIEMADEFEAIADNELLNCPPHQESKRFWYFSDKVAALNTAISALNGDDVFNG